MIHLKGILSKKREMGNAWKQAESGTFSALIQQGRQFQKKKSELSREKVGLESRLGGCGVSEMSVWGRRGIRGF